MGKPRGRDESKPRRRKDSGRKATIRSSTIPGQPKYRHYGQQPLKRVDGIPELAKNIPVSVLPREMIEPLHDSHVRFLVAFWRIGKESEALAAIGYSKSGFNKWKAKEEFREAYDLMRAVIDDRWEREFERSWREGYEEHEDVYQDDPHTGERKRIRVKTRVKKDPATLRLIMQGRKPHIYGKAGGPGGTTINIVVERPDAKKEILPGEVEAMPVEIVEEDRLLESGDE